jgi:hypothetical protein
MRHKRGRLMPLRYLLRPLHEGLRGGRRPDTTPRNYPIDIEPPGTPKHGIAHRSHAADPHTGSLQVRFEPGHSPLNACTPAIALCKRLGRLGLSSLIRLNPCGRVLPPPLFASGATGSRTALLHRTATTPCPINADCSSCGPAAGPHWGVPLRTDDHTADRVTLEIFQRQLAWLGPFRRHGRGDQGQACRGTLLNLTETAIMPIPQETGGVEVSLTRGCQRRLKRVTIMLCHLVDGTMGDEIRWS